MNICTLNHITTITTKQMPPWVIFEMNKWQTFQANAKWYWLVVLYLIIVWNRRPCYDFQTYVFRVSVAEDVRPARSSKFYSLNKKNGVQMKGNTKKLIKKKSRRRRSIWDKIFFRTANGVKTGESYKAKKCRGGIGS